MKPTELAIIEEALDGMTHDERVGFVEGLKAARAMADEHHICDGYTSALDEAADLADR